MELPAKIGQYQIKRLLGAGAMGHVYLAHDPHLDRDVAIKVLPRELTADEERVSRFLREARLTAKIQHSNTVVIHQVMVEEGLASIVMEFVDGGSLDEIVEKQGPMPWREATRAIRDAAAGLGAAHEMGLVHRDIKPANLMRTCKGTVKVVDFGLVRAMRSTSQLTQMGTILGTPTYMAPEQWMGQEADARSDLYSLVCTYYYLLTGKEPFAADSIPALGYQHRYEPFPDARKFVSDLPPAVCRILARGTEKEPAERFQTAAELIAALDELLAMNVAEFAYEAIRESEEIEELLDPEEIFDGGADGTAPKNRRQASRQAVMRAPPNFDEILKAEGVFDPTAGVTAPEKPPVRKTQPAKPTPGLQLVGSTQKTAIPPEMRARDWLKAAAAGLIGGVLLFVIILYVFVTNASRKSAMLDEPKLPPAIRQTADSDIRSDSPTEIAVDLGNNVKLEMVLIRAGEFMMGSPDSDQAGERPQHRVRITKPFYLGKYLVTQEQWEAVMGDNPSHFKGPKNPVEMVSWNDCQQFLVKLNAKIGAQSGAFRLPSEAQWEYTCRAGSTTRYCFGDDESQLGEYAWYTANSGNTTHPVGEKKPNPWGLYDMHGNVWEWCQDWYGAYGAEATDDPTGPAMGSDRVFRGGSWDHPARICRSASRDCHEPGYRYDYLGFRASRVLAE